MNRLSNTLEWVLKTAEPAGVEALGNFSGDGPAATVSADQGNLVRKVPPSSQQMGRRNQAQELIGETAGPGHLEQQAGFGTKTVFSNLSQMEDAMGGGKFGSTSPSGTSLLSKTARAQREVPVGAEIDFQSLGMLLGLAEGRKLAEDEEAKSPGSKLISGARSAASTARELLTGIRSTARGAAKLLAQPTGRTVYTSRGER